MHAPKAIIESPGKAREAPTTDRFQGKGMLELLAAEDALRDRRHGDGTTLHADGGALSLRPTRPGGRAMSRCALGTSASDFRWAVGIENTFIPQTRAGHR